MIRTYLKHEQKQDLHCTRRTAVLLLASSNERGTDRYIVRFTL